MPRNAGIVVENNFKNGLITEATGLNFPEHACTETFDCEFNLDGSVNRRLGFDFELNNATKNIDRTNNVVNGYLWRNVSGDGNLTVYVVQVGSTIYFYKTSSTSVSLGAIASTVTLTPVASAPPTNTVEAQFCDGNGYLVVTHPYCEPMRVSYDTSTDTVSSTNITLMIRDFEGAIADPYAVDDRHTATVATMDVNHLYNLKNQGWTDTNLTAWDTAQTTVPSNADIQWRFKDSTDAFDFSSGTIAKRTFGNTPAPKGHYILTLSNQNRDAAAGTTGVASTTTGTQRPSTCAFFAGRVFYAGINKSGFNSNIYFTQILENINQYGNCYQLNDPTSEDLFDLLPNDGGVIKIPEAGTIYKLFAVPGGLAVFAANGVWFITGSTGIGFTANDYTQQKIAKITTISASSFVDVAGYPAWWNTEGIYIMAVDGSTTIPTIKPLVYTTIKTFYAGIPASSKANAKGFYNFIDGTIQWLFKSTDTNVTTNAYEFDRVLTYNVYTSAFYPWTISSNGQVTVNAMFVIESISGITTMDSVIDGSANNVIDGSGNQIVSFTIAGTSQAALQAKFLASYPSGGSYLFTFAEVESTSYLDWLTFDAVGVNYTSYFISGYKLRGEGSRKWETSWLNLYNRLDRVDTPISYTFQGLWDYKNTAPGTGRWTTTQTVSHSDLTFGTAKRRLKVRGHGQALQFKISSVQGKPFDLIGWSTYDTVNPIP